MFTYNLEDLFSVERGPAKLREGDRGRQEEIQIPYLCIDHDGAKTVQNNDCILKSQQANGGSCAPLLTHEFIACFVVHWHLLDPIDACLVWYQTPAQLRPLRSSGFSALGKPRVKTGAWLFYFYG